MPRGGTCSVFMFVIVMIIIINRARRQGYTQGETLNK